MFDPLAPSLCVETEIRCRVCQRRFHCTVLFSEPAAGEAWAADWFCCVGCQDAEEQRERVQADMW